MAILACAWNSWHDGGMRYDPFMVPESLADIEQLIRGEVQENIHLDYKDSRAIRKDARDEIAKDVSAFANSDGGVLIYGVREKGHLPIEMDNGVDDSECSREWVEAAVMARITPRVEVKITPTPVSSGRSMYVIEVPKPVGDPIRLETRSTTNGTASSQTSSQTRLRTMK